VGLPRGVRGDALACRGHPYMFNIVNTIQTAVSSQSASITFYISASCHSLDLFCFNSEKVKMLFPNKNEEVNKAASVCF
jgi:hypothetical protein